MTRLSYKPSHRASFPTKYTRETALEWRAMLKNPGNGQKPLTMKKLEEKLGLPRNTVTKILDKFGV